MRAVSQSNLLATAGDRSCMIAARLPVLAVAPPATAAGQLGIAIWSPVAAGQIAETQFAVRNPAMHTMHMFDLRSIDSDRMFDLRSIDSDRRLV
jgi:hypothetical protein